MKISILTTQNCGYCHMLKDYLDSKGLEYKSFDAHLNQEKFREFVSVTNSLGVPQILIENEGKTNYIVGFDRIKLSEFGI